MVIPHQTSDNMKINPPSYPKRLLKKAKKGFRGYPLATIAFYGPDDHLASKVSVGVIGKDEELIALEKWFSKDNDVRNAPRIGEEILQFIEKYEVKSVAITDSIIGCPHEEGVDYEGEICPECPFWTNRDRWTGGIMH